MPARTGWRHEAHEFRGVARRPQEVYEIELQLPQDRLEVRRRLVKRIEAFAESNGLVGSAASTGGRSLMSATRSG